MCGAVNNNMLLIFKDMLVNIVDFYNYIHNTHLVATLPYYIDKMYLFTFTLCRL